VTKKSNFKAVKKQFTLGGDPTTKILCASSILKVISRHWS